MMWGFNSICSVYAAVYAVCREGVFMRIRESFSLYKRKMPSGLSVFYYQAYDGNGKRSCGHSTGQTTKTAAREYCMGLLREGKLLTKKERAVPTLREWAEDFWDMEKSGYLRGRKGRRPITIGYVKNGRSYTENQIVPFFGDMRLDAITEVEIENWLTGFEGRGLSNGTANNAYKMLSVMLGYAWKQKIIKSNPCRLVEKLKSAEREIKILTPDEVKGLFPARWSDVWDDYTCYVVNKLAACTGMRIGEIMGLRSEFVHEGYLEVCRQYSQTAGYSDVKTHKPRVVPMHKALERDVRGLIATNGEGFVFVTKPRAVKPMGRAMVINSFFKALEAIGIDEARRKERNLTFHGWRHFFNTYLLTENVSEAKVMEVTGHLTEKNKKRYTHFDATKFYEVMEAQKSLIEHRGRKKTSSK
jgi:integrase